MTKLEKRDSNNANYAKVMDIILPYQVHYYDYKELIFETDFQ